MSGDYFPFIFYSSVLLLMSTAFRESFTQVRDKWNYAGNLSHPNIIIFLADDLGYGDPTFSGHPTSQTPNIDALAANGRVLTHFYVTSPVCSPSRASFLTGRYHVRSGVYPGTFVPNSVLGIPHNETTIAKLLKEKGYNTKIIGKWHLGVGFSKEYLPTNPAYGFDSFFGSPYSHDMCDCVVCFPNNGTCLEGCWEGYVSCPLFDDDVIVEQPVYLPSLTERFLFRAENFVVNSNQEGSPFFLYFPFHQIHHPQFASARFYNTSARYAVGDALVEMDWAVGSLVRTLEQLGLIDDTLIWFTSDNGPSLQRHERGGCAGPLRCGKGTTWDGGVRVPSVIHWPRRITPGRSNALTSSLDILPTISSITNISIDHLVLDGIDISQVLLEDVEDEEPRKFFAVYPENPAEAEGPFAVVYGKYKAHFYTLGSDLSDKDNYDPMCPATHPLTQHVPPLLFDLYRDPGERYDLGQLEEYSDIVSVMTEWRDQHMQNMTWLPPRTQIYNERAEPCCTSPLCSPFPECCDCQATPLHSWPSLTSNNILSQRYNENEINYILFGN